MGYFSHLAAAGCKTHVNAQARYTRRVVFYIFCPRVTNGVHLWRGEVLRSCGQVQRVCIDFIQIKAVGTATNIACLWEDGEKQCCLSGKPLSSGQLWNKCPSNY